MKTSMFIFLAMTASFSVGNACTELLQGLQTSHLQSGSLCDLQDRYQRAKDTYEVLLGYGPIDRIADLRGPRFINPTTWNERSRQNGANPWSIYDPAPTTWQRWEDGANAIDAKVADNIRHNRIHAIDLNYIRGIQRPAMQGLMNNRSNGPGEFRTIQVYGLSLKREDAQTQEQIAVTRLGGGIQSHVDPSRGILTWHPVQCLEDHDASFQAAYNQAGHGFRLTEWTDNDVYFTDANGVRRQCGYLLYPATSEIQTELQAYIRDFNSLTGSWGTSQASGDPIMVAAHLQKFFVSIHPFPDGNGRTSRFIMDLVLKSLGLPAPILQDMNLDTATMESDWADEVGRGLVRAVEIAERCVANPADIGCNIVPTRAP